MRNRLERLRPQVEALARFNDMVELGPPVGEEVQQMFKDVSASHTLCQVAEDDLNLDDVPYCQSCLLTFDVEISRREVETLFGYTEGAMREYNRRLSSHSIRQILAHPTREISTSAKKYSRCSRTYRRPIRYAKLRRTT